MATDQFGNPIGVRRASSSVYYLAPTAKTATFTTADIDASDLTELSVTVNVTAVSGTSPTLQVGIDRKLTSGTYVAILNSSTITATGVTTFSVGSGLVNNVSMGRTIRLWFVIGGTTPSFTMEVQADAR